MGEEHYFDELELNSLGLQLLFGRNRTDDALMLLALNIEEHPRSYNVYDTMGYVLRRLGRTDDALACYRKGIAVFDADPVANEVYRSDYEKAVKWARRPRRSLAPAVVRRPGGALPPAVPTTDQSPGRSLEPGIQSRPHDAQRVHVRGRLVPGKCRARSRARCAACRSRQPRPYRDPPGAGRERGATP